MTSNRKYKYLEICGIFLDVSSINLKGIKVQNQANRDMTTVYKNTT